MSDILPTEPTPESEPGWQQPPTQVLFPLQAILRTVVQAGVGALVAWLVVRFPGVADELQQIQGPAVEIAMYGLTVVATTLMAWLMTRPAVNRALSQIGLGAKPRHLA